MPTHSTNRDPTIVAQARDGWAFVRADNELFELRPPYRKQDRRPAQENEMRRGVLDEDFVIQDPPLTFKSWGDLARHLSRLVIANSTEEERQTAKEAPEKLLAYANSDQAREHVRALREHMHKVPEDRIRRLAIALLGAAAVFETRELYDEVLDILGELEHRSPAFVASQQYPVSDENHLEKIQSGHGSFLRKVG